MSDNEVLDGLLEETFAAPAAPPEAEGSSESEAQAAPEPEEESSQTPAPSTEDAAAQAEPSTPVDPPAPQEQSVAPAPINWETDDNPYRQQANEAQQTLTAARQYVAQIAEQHRQQQLAAQFQGLSELDPEQVPQSAAHLVTQVAGPLAEQLKQALAEKEQTEKEWTADHITRRFGLGEQDQRIMLSLKTWQEMEQYAQGKQSERNVRDAEFNAVKSKIAELELQLAGQQRLDSGADQVGSANGSPAGGKRLEDITDFDEWFNSDQW